MEQTNVLKRIIDFLAGLPMTAVGGIFLLASFILSRIGYPTGDYLACGCVLICGIPLLYLAIWRLIYNQGISKISSALLISMAMIAAILIGDLFAAGEVAFIMAIGAILEEKTTERARKGLQKLVSLTPQTGRRIKNGQEEIIPANQIQQGDILRILPGEAIPVDGIIRHGETSIDQSIMTGESLPVDKGIGETVFCGTMNRFGSIDIEASNVGKDSSLQKLIHMVAEAENKQAPSQRIADQWASWLVPFSIVTAIVTYFVTEDISRAVTILIVFCPCALVLATPTAIMAAIGQATQHGIIIKSGEALERLGHVKTIAFDKTGTITLGKLTVSDVITFDGSESDHLLALAASAESKSEHPLGKAVTASAKNKGLPLRETSGFSMSAGKGICAAIDSRKLYIGSEKYLKENLQSIDSPIYATIETLRRQGKVAIIVAENGRAIGVIALSDTLRPEAKDMVQRLAALETKAILLTGDNQNTADFFASQIGITEIHAGLLPEDKVAKIAEVRKTDSICMIGDGINDAPALKTADVGVAMGTMGSDITVDAADVVLMTDDISRLPYLKWLSNATIKTIRLAISISMGINFAAIILSVLGILTPTTGALVHNAGSCFVVLLAALLYDRKYRPSSAKQSDA